MNTILKKEMSNFAIGDNPIPLISLLKDSWWTPKLGFKLLGKWALRLELHTLGWRENEEIINQLMGSEFWFLYWEKSIRGGHHYFRIITEFKRGGD